MPSSFGFQPLPLTPPDFKEYLHYQNTLNGMIKDSLHKPGKVDKVDKPEKISLNSHKDVKRRNRNRSK